jgi:hypothetical protein
MPAAQSSRSQPNPSRDRFLEFRFRAGSESRVHFRKSLRESPEMRAGEVCYMPSQATIQASQFVAAKPGRERGDALPDQPNTLSAPRPNPQGLAAGSRCVVPGSQGNDHRFAAHDPLASRRVARTAHRRALLNKARWIYRSSSHAVALPSEHPSQFAPASRRVFPCWLFSTRRPSYPARACGGRS